MKAKFLILILLAGIFLRGNTIFAPLGVPLQSYGNDVYGLGMGNTGISDLYRINGNQENASLLTTSNIVTISTAMNMGYYWYKSDTETFKDDELYLPFFTLSIPIKMHRLGISLNSVYSGNLFTGSKGLIFTPDTSETSLDSLQYDEIIRKTEELFKTSLHYAIKSKYANLGISLQYYFGNQVRYWSLDFAELTMTDSKYEVEKNYSGISYKIGASRKFDTVSVGLSYEPSVKLKGDKVYRYNFYPQEESLKDDEELYKVPTNINGGLTWIFKKTFKLGLECNYILWSETVEEYTTENGNMKKYDNSWRLGTGIAYDPLSGIGKWYNRIPLRAGASLSKLPFKSENSQIYEVILSAGSTIKLDSSGRKIDIAVRYAYRGNREQSGYRDKSLQLVIGLTGFDIFRKTIKRTGEREIPKVDPGMESREDRQ